MSSDDVLEGGGDKQKLLLEADFFAELCIIIRVEDIGQRRIFSCLVEKARVIALKLKIAGRFFGRPKAKR